MKLTLSLDSSQIVSYMICPQNWNNLYHKNIRKADLKKTALDRGTIIHNLADIYYNLRALDPKGSYSTHANSTVEMYRKNFTERIVDKEDLEFLFKRFGQYIFRWAATGNDFRPLIKNGRPSVELGFSEIIHEDENYLFIIEGRLDLLASIGETIFWVDHKSQEQEKHLYKMKPQFMTYGLATGLPGIINYIGLQKELKPSHLRRTELMIFPRWKLDKWKERIINKVFIPLATTLANNYSFEESDESCSGAYDSTPCQFTDICECQSLEMRNQVEKFKYVQVKPWRPW